MKSWLSMWVPNENGQQLQLQPPSTVALKLSGKKKKSSQKAKLWEIHLVILLGGQKTDLQLEYIWTHRQWQRA